MTEDDVKSLFSDLASKRADSKLLETHISWVILYSDYAYKIKKPIHYTFIDFSTVEKRKQALEKELSLNNRLAPDLYLEVVSIHKSGAHLEFSDKVESSYGYALKMKRMDPDRQMDHLMRKGKVTTKNIQALAHKISEFHARVKVIPPPFDMQDQRDKYADILNTLKETSEIISDNLRKSIHTLTDKASKYEDSHEDIFLKRGSKGYVRDCHGDLTSKNIFLAEEPVIFDCIEFDDTLRHIDILNELAFFCMDMDHFGRKDLGSYFVECYMNFSQSKYGNSEKSLFNYYKSYRANVRAKVNMLRALQTTNTEKNDLLDSTRKYIGMADDYLTKTV